MYNNFCFFFYWHQKKSLAKEIFLKVLFLLLYFFFKLSKRRCRLYVSTTVQSKFHNSKRITTRSPLMSGTAARKLPDWILFLFFYNEIRLRRCFPISTMPSRDSYIWSPNVQNIKKETLFKTPKVHFRENRPNSPCFLVFLCFFIFIDIPEKSGHLFWKGGRTILKSCFYTACIFNGYGPQTSPKWHNILY